MEIDPRVHRAFFARFGGRLRPVQEAAFTELKDDRDALVMAQTGSGKTEAVLAPVAQRLCNSDESRAVGLRALIISPTKALAGDLHRRMAPLYAELGLRMDVATSDKRTVGTKPTDILIRTPEGLDRDLCYKRDTMRGVTDIVVDELHKFLDGPRGTQLSGLLTRLDATAPGHRRLGISATVADPRAPAEMRLLRDPVVVDDSVETGSIDLLFHHWSGPKGQEAARFVDWLRAQGVRKGIGFVGQRARAEIVSRLVGVGPFKGKAFAHHADLSTAERRKVEDALRRNSAGLVVATTTLEVGIDIGTIDTCILFDAPPDRSAFLQRIGRAGRRSGVRRVVCVVGLFDRKVAFTRVASPGGAPVMKPDYRPFLAGCIQQTLSLLSAHNGLGRGEIKRFWSAAFGIEASGVSRLVDALAADGWITERAEHMMPGPLLHELRAGNRLHLTFAGSSGIKLIDEVTGRSLGFVSAQPGEEVVIGARGRKITGYDFRRGVAMSTPSEIGTAQFAPRGRSVFEQMAVRYAQYLGKQVRLE